jgi:type I restriction enzyme S subunit
MIQGLKPYPAYRNSGVPWLGQVPEYWEVRRLKSALVRNDSGYWGSDFSTIGPFVLRSNEQTVDGGWRIVAPARRSLTPKEQAESILEAGDLVITKSSGSEKHIGKTSLVTPAIAAMCCCFSNFMQRIRLNDRAEPKMVWYLLNNTVGREQLINASSTTTGLANLTGTIIGNLYFAFPPLSEQAAIVRSLDHIDRLIRRYIQAKQKLIKLLQEQKQAGIHRAISCGLDPSVSLKPSGAESLGEVPEHWKRMRLKHIAAVQTGITLGKIYQSEKLEERPYLRVANVQDGYLNLNEVKTIRVPQHEAASCELVSGDVLMTEGGDIDKLGRGYIWQGEIPGCLHQNHIFAVRTDKRHLLPEYLSALMTSDYGRNYFQLTAKKTTNLASTNSTTLKSFPIFLPGIQEQEEILAYIGRESSCLDAAISKSLRQIAIIREYRTRLITDVVTGKLDVREAAANLPDELKEQEPLDEADTEVESEGAEEVMDSDLDASPEEVEA